MKREIVVGYVKGRVANKYRPNAGCVTIEMELRDTPKGPELSVCGNVWNRSGSDIKMGGQCVDQLAEHVDTWLITREAYARIVALWKAYHLNGMNAGCEHQRAENWQPWMLSKPCPTCEYKYGTAWLYSPIPADDLREIQAVIKGGGL